MSEYDHMMRGGKVGTGAPASAQYEAIDRRERLRRMALEVREMPSPPKLPHPPAMHSGARCCLRHTTAGGRRPQRLVHPTLGKRALPHDDDESERVARAGRSNCELRLQTINIDKDPYFMKNHLGSYAPPWCPAPVRGLLCRSHRARIWVAGHVAHFAGCAPIASFMGSCRMVPPYILHEPAALAAAVLQI